MIEVIEEDGFLTELKVMSPTSGGCSAKTILAQVEWSDGVVRDTYIKIFDHQDRVKEILNESFGHLCANTVGLEQPEKVALIKISVDDYAPSASDRYASDNGFYYAWASTTIGSENLKKIYFKNPENNGLPEEWKNYADFLQSWEKFPCLISLDDWIGNSDRNPGNIIFINKNRLGIIDHGRLFGVHDWRHEPVDPNSDVWMNQALECFKIFYKPSSPNHIACQPIFNEAIEHSTVFQIHKDMIESQIVNIVKILEPHHTSAETLVSAFINYCLERLKTINIRLRTRLGHLGATV